MTNSVRARRLATPLIALPVLAAGLLSAASAPSSAAAQDFDAAAAYQANKCAMCHSAKAEKHFDATKADDVLALAIEEGLKAEKPPNMPAYKDKGIDEAKAKALVTYMKSLKQQP